MHRPRVRVHIVLALLWLGAGLVLLLVSLGDANATDIVPLLILWCGIGGWASFVYRKYRGSKVPQRVRPRPVPARLRLARRVVDAFRRRWPETDEDRSG